MAFGISAATWAMIGAATAASVTVYNADKQAKKANEMQQQAQTQAIEQTKIQATATENQAQVQAAGRVKNNKSADASSIMADAQARMGGGGGGTMLTGPQGIDPAALSLSKNTLLGM